MPKTVIRWKNGMVMAFDADGRQMPELQGRYEDVYVEIMQRAQNEHFIFKHGDWNDNKAAWTVQRSEW